MTQATASGTSYIIAARRTALGRPGGLHRARRIETLTAPIVLAALEDAGLEPGVVDEIIFGNTTAGGNPARIIGLAAGLRGVEWLSSIRDPKPKPRWDLHGWAGAGWHR